jgi:hypothetical protein
VYVSSSLSGRVIRVAPVNILSAMASCLKINLPYSVIWNAADTVDKDLGYRLFAVRGRQGNVDWAWNKLGTRHEHDGHALLVL